MFRKHLSSQYTKYHAARADIVNNPSILIDLEELLTNHIVQIITAAKAEIKADYDEASYLYPFWQNYPPDDRGRAPVGDQIPWIEVGEHSIGSKLPRLLAPHYSLADSGLPTGADQRFVVGSDAIHKATKGLTRHAWLFIDIKSIGPRDDQDHTVMSHNQVSGDGIWSNQNDGVRNSVIAATGARTSHPFHCSMPPIFVLSSGVIAPVVILALKPVYEMVPSQGTQKNAGQPLQRIDLACIPNGLLMQVNPGYLTKYPNLLFPGKDDKGKDPRKVRARVSFDLLRKLGAWRHQTISY